MPFRHPNVRTRFDPGGPGLYTDPLLDPVRRPRRQASPGWGIDDPERMMDAAAQLYGGRLNPKQSTAIRAILSKGNGLPIGALAYALATADHETGRFQFDEEIGRGRGKAYGVPGPDGQTAYGRGDAQLTWAHNYEEFDKALGLNGALKKNYDLAKDPEVSARILIYGLTRDQGFTGAGGTQKYLPDQEPADFGQFVKARRIVNGSNQAEKIARRAVEFQDALASAGYTYRPGE